MPRSGDRQPGVIGHFVDQARRSGASWTEIGRSMGVGVLSGLGVHKAATEANIVAALAKVQVVE